MGQVICGKIEVICSKISKNLGIISKIRHILPSILTRSLYLTLIESYINYCNLVWSSSGKSQVLNRVLKIQKRYARLISFSSYRAHSHPLFKKLSILTVYQIYQNLCESKSWSSVMFPICIAAILFWVPMGRTLVFRLHSPSFPCISDSRCFLRHVKITSTI